MSNDTPASRQRTVLIASSAALLMLAGIAGCSRSDEAKEAVSEAGRNFTSVAAGDSTASPSFSEATYRKNESIVEPFKGDEDGYAEAAAISYSLSKLGQASLASMQASKMETRSLQQARVIRGMINEWLTMSAIAKAAGQFDPSGELTEIDKIITMRQEDIEQYKAQREAIESEIAQHESQIADLRSKAEFQRNESGALELQMSRVSATEAAEIVQRVREFTLRADQYELEAIRIEGVVGQLRPGAREVGLNVEKATSQIELLNAARKELHDRDISSRNDAKLATEAAVKAAARITQAAADYAKFRENEVASANETTISLTRASISALRDAKRATKKVAMLSKSTAQQTLGECYTRQAAGYREASILYNALSEAGVPGDWASPTKAADEAQNEAKAAANGAFTDAASSLRGARFRGIEQEKLEATAVRLEELAGIVPEPEYDESSENEAQDATDQSSMDEESADEDATQEGDG